MINPICISTGLVYRLTNDRNEMVERLRQFSPDGIEISFADPQFLFDFTPTRSNLEYLRTTRTSIHAPWKHIIYGNNDLCRIFLGELQKLSNLVDAKNVTFHKSPEDNFSVLADYSFPCSVENDDYKFVGKAPTSPEEVRAVLSQYPRMGFTFDFPHALTVDPGSIPEFLRFPEISQIHLSYLSRELPDHYFLYKNDSPRLRALIRQIPPNIPIVLECVSPNEQEVELAKREVEYLRSI